MVLSFITIPVYEIFTQIIGEGAYFSTLPIYKNSVNMKLSKFIISIKNSTNYVIFCKGTNFFW